MSLRQSYIAKLSMKNIWAHRLRSVLTIAGVAIGVGFVVFLVSLGYGLQRISTQEISNLDALQVIDVTPGKSKVVKVNDAGIDKMTRLSNVVSVAPELSIVGKTSYGTSITESVVYGKNKEFLNLESPQLEKGKIYTDNQSNDAIINSAAVRQLGIKDQGAVIGKEITTTINLGSDFLEADAPAVNKEYKLKIVGVLKDDSSPYIYIPLEKLRAAGAVNYTSAKIKVSSKNDVDGTKRQLENLGYKTTTLKDTVDQINQFFTIFQLILLSFGIIAVIVAALGMFNTLTISLLEKTREISFMKVLGAEQKDVWQIFLAEAVLIGILGTLLGVFWGMAVGDSLNNFLIALAHKTGNKPVEIFYTPPAFVAIVVASSVAMSILTGIYPSFRATRIDPLEAMRYE